MKVQRVDEVGDRGGAVRRNEHSPGLGRGAEREEDVLALAANWVEEGWRDRCCCRNASSMRGGLQGGKNCGKGEEANSSKRGG